MDNPVHSTPEEREKRLSEIKIYLQEFCGELSHIEKVNISLKENAAEYINELYYRYADELIRPTIDSGRIQNFKIAAMMELMILLVNPILVPDPEETKFYNSRLALYFALRFIVEWNENGLDIQKCYQVINNESDFLLFLDEHFKWLYLLDPNYYNPVFFNAQIWRLFFYLLRERTAKMA